MTRRALLASLGVAAATRDLELRAHAGINAQRHRNGIAPLVWNPALAGTARDHSRRMLTAGFFAHTDPQRGDLIQRVNAAAIAWTRLAENIFREQGYQDPVSMAIAQWLDSAGHRVNLLGPAFTETGIGVAVSSDQEFYITQQFLRAA